MLGMDVTLFPIVTQYHLQLIWRVYYQKEKLKPQRGLYHHCPCKIFLGNRKQPSKHSKGIKQSVGPELYSKREQGHGYVMMGRLSGAPCSRKWGLTHQEEDGTRKEAVVGYEEREGYMT